MHRTKLNIVFNVSSIVVPYAEFKAFRDYSNKSPAKSYAPFSDAQWYCKNNHQVYNVSTRGQRNSHTGHLFSSNYHAPHRVSITPTTPPHTARFQGYFQPHMDSANAIAIYDYECGACITCASSLSS